MASIYIPDLKSVPIIKIDQCSGHQQDQQEIEGVEFFAVKFLYVFEDRGQESLFIKIK